MWLRKLIKAALWSEWQQSINHLHSLQLLLGQFIMAVYVWPLASLEFPYSYPPWYSGTACAVGALESPSAWV